ncbi:MAG: RluA family pseudouridine synthase [Bdellovibrionales bacterium]
MSYSRIEITVPEEHAGLRLDKFLSLHETIRSRSRADHLIELGLVQVNGKILKGSYGIRSGDLILVKVPQEKVRSLEPANIPLEILFEDQDVLVVNKPAGLVVHPSAGHENQTLVNALLHHTRDLSMRFHEERPGIVHRIDKETSGLLVVAKNDQAHELLVQEFQARRVHRIYKAVCFGQPQPPAGRIESHLGRHPVDRKRFASVHEGKWSATHYKTLSSAHSLSYLELKLETGRTHQIRVHMSEKGHPLVGDQLYGSSKKIRSVPSSVQDEIRNLNRFLLHAEQLGFQHPTTKKQVSFSVDWPSEIGSLLSHWGLR